MKCVYGCFGVTLKYSCYAVGGTSNYQYSTDINTALRFGLNTNFFSGGQYIMKIHENPAKEKQSELGTPSSKIWKHFWAGSEGVNYEHFPNVLSYYLFQTILR